ncbi:hypothetical protein BH10PSE5_BH10PSE5_01320 [soil metagenome]
MAKFVTFTRNDGLVVAINPDQVFELTEAQTAGHVVVKFVASGGHTALVAGSLEEVIARLEGQAVSQTSVQPLRV